MEIRPATATDVQQFMEIDGTIDSSSYVHIDRSGEGVAVSWKSEQRPLREKLIAAAPLHSDDLFLAKQVVQGDEPGVVFFAAHADQPAALLLAVIDHRYSVARLVDLRVDSDFRRQGLATVMLFRLIEWARDQGVRAITIETRANNAPIAALLQKPGFQVSGLDICRHSNHDLVEEAATLFWYLEVIE